MYLSWDKKTITDFSEKNIETLYNQGYVFTRTGKGEMDQTRSVRIDLSKFKLNSENRRVLRKTENVMMETAAIPYTDYHWSIGKLGKDFYTKKFGDGTFSAQKIKELLTDAKKSNFNKLLIYKIDGRAIGYCVLIETTEINHYCYPFYNLENEIPNLGIGMMTKAIIWAQEHNKKYVYLGSAKDAASLYKFQFEGVEWFDGEKWQTETNELKKLLK